MTAAHVDLMLSIWQRNTSGDPRRAMRQVLRAHDSTVALTRPAPNIAPDVTATLEVVCRVVGCATLAELLNQDRHTDAVRKRRVAAVVLRRRGLSLHTIGAALKRDHSSVFHSLRMGERDARVMELVGEVEAATGP